MLRQVPITRLADPEAEALARVLPNLLCGEESSVLVFERERLRMAGEAWRASARLFGEIEAEEEEHAQLLYALRDTLPRPAGDRARRSRARRFFMRLQAADSVAEHFARVAELDACVCVLMSAFADSSVGRPPPLRALFELVRRDERRHVRASRAHVAALGGVVPTGIRESVTTALVELLAFEGAAFEALGVDPDRLLGRLSGGA